MITYSYCTYCLISVFDKLLRFVKSDELCHTNYVIPIKIQETGKREGESGRDDCRRQVGWGGCFDVRNMSLKPVSFVMCFKHFHTRVKFLPLMVFLLQVPVPNHNVRTNSHKSCDPTRPSDSDTALAKLYLHTDVVRKPIWQ